MQVAQIDDRITHAVAGGKKVQSYSIAQTAEFFQVLSSSLYSNKKLAVIRETLCNAWDAHIEGGVTDTPVQITLDDKKLVIKDFGPGIHPDDVPNTYCTYGGTTKIQNDNVTGGFGLGCKAPFAYTDHFEVTSCHEGTKTIYRMSLSSAAVGGLPSMTEIVSIPTDETGLTVSIDLKDPYDKEKFEALIRMIAAFGEMRVELNGSKVKTIPFNTAKHGFLIVRGNLIPDNNSPLCVRYGNVVYPIERHHSYEIIFDKVLGTLKRLRNNSDYHYSYRGSVEWTIVLQAPPNTISVTPSRESISMTEYTINTLVKLMKEYVEFTTSVDYKSHLSTLLKARIEECGLTYAPKNLLDLGLTPRWKQSQEKAQEIRYIATAEEMADYVFHYNRYPPDIRGLRWDDFQWRIKAMMDLGFNNRNCAHSMLRTAYRDGDGRSHWFHLKYLWPIIREMGKDVDHKRLYIHNKHFSGRALLATKVSPDIGLEYFLPFLRDIVVLVYTRNDLERAYHLPVFRHWIGPMLEGCLYYQAPRSPKKVEAARKHFESLGMNVLDLTVPLPGEAPIVVQPAKKPIPVTTRKKGLPKLSASLRNNCFSLHQAYDDNTPRIENPEFIIIMSNRISDHSTFSNGWGVESSAALIRMFGDKGAIARNELHAHSYIAKGAKDISDWLPSKLLEEITNNPKIKQHFEYSIEHRKNLDIESDIFDLILNDEVLSKKFKIAIKPNQRAQDFAGIWNKYSTYAWEISNNKDLTAIKDIIDKCDLNSNVKKLTDLLTDNELLPVINCYRTRSILRGSSVTPEALKMKTKVRKIILSLLEE